MAKANYVGRVGALAVALGIGTAVVVSPGVVWAQPGDDTSSSGNAESSSENSVDEPSQDSDTQEESEGEGDDPQPDETDEDESVDPDDEAGDEEPEKPRKRSSHESKQDETPERVTDRSGAEAADGDEPADAAEPEISKTVPDTQQPTAPIDVDPEPVTPAPTVAGDDAAEDTAVEEPATAPISVLQTVFAPLTTQSGSGAPEGPVESPLLWAILAYTRRQSDREKAEIVKTGAPAGTIGLVEDADNSAPVPGEVTTGDPGFFTGSVSGQVTATDPDGDRLTFSGSTTNDKGRVTVYSSGRFSYTPTAAARHAAAADDATDEQKLNTFTVTITDSAGNVATKLVSIDISPTNAVPFGARARAGAGNLSTGSVIVTVGASDFDRDTLTFTGPASTDKGTLVDNGDGTFTYTPTAAAREAAGEPGAPASARTDTLTFTVSDGHGGIQTATVNVDVTPVVEASASTPGRAAGPVIVSSNGTIYQVTYDVDSTNTPIRTRVSILDEDGQVLRTTEVGSGYPVEQALPVVRSDGSLLVTTYKTSSNTTTISVVDGFGTVKTVGTVIGQPSAPVEVAPNGAVYLQTRQFSQSGDRLVRISATNTVRVYQVGKAGGGLTVAPDGTAYLVGTTPLFGTPSLLAVGPGGNSRRVSLPLGTSAPETVVIGPDGRGYLTVARTFFGTTTTRVYTFAGTSNTVRQLPGSPVTGEVVTDDGVYQATYDEATGTTYISRITADIIETSDPIDGRIWNQLSVTPDGTVYVSVRDPVTQVFSVAVVNSAGEVTTVVIPGAIPAVLPGVPPAEGQAANPNIGENGYVSYISGGTTYLAVLNPDGTIARTVALPDGGTVGNPVTFAPDGAPYQVIQFKDAQGRVTSQAVLSLSNDAVTPILLGSPVRPNFPELQFGPDGTAFLVTVESATFTYHFLGFDQNGATVVTLDATGPLVPQQSDYVFDQAVLAFGADGTAYATFAGPDAGVWALTPDGATKVLDLDLGPGETVQPVAFGPDGTPYVTVTERVGTDYVTTVETFTPPTVL